MVSQWGDDSSVIKGFEQSNSMVLLKFAFEDTLRQIKSNQIVLVTYTWLADVIAKHVPKQIGRAHV